MFKFLIGIIKHFNILKLFKALIEYIFSSISTKSNGVFQHFADMIKNFQTSNKSEFIKKLTGEQHVSLIVQKTVASLIKQDIHHKDRKDARKRDLLSTSKNTKTLLYLSFIGLTACLMMLWLIPDMTADVICIIATASGIFGSCLKDAYVFEFGSRDNQDASKHK
ncbi:MAG: hypothetical protein H6845_02485 [Alphaproteobacteria bacterium]|nr:MAG: hypothetical protein H6845_02485 [Alphaproteobacteria bacterium]